MSDHQDIAAVAAGFAVGAGLLLFCPPLILVGALLLLYALW